MDFSHTSVMGAEAVRLLDCKKGAIYVDGTLGGGGHTLEILKASNPDGMVVGIDLDEDALKAAGKLLGTFGDRAKLVRGNFRDIRSVLAGLDIKGVDGIIFDLGVSSYQLDTAERGFSFMANAPLDMRMDQRQELSAYDIVNDFSADELARIFHEYGEERFSRKIAGLIDKVRSVKPIETTGELVHIILDAIPRKFHAGRIHPATRVFQALRIAVNDELGSLEKGISDGFECLKKNGRFVVISFHSLEDRIVKNAFRDFSTGCICPPRVPKCVCGRTPAARMLTKKALTPTEEEVARNPRSRSAKMRAIEKI